MNITKLNCCAMSLSLLLIPSLHCAVQRVEEWAILLIPSIQCAMQPAEESAILLIPSIQCAMQRVESTNDSAPIVKSAPKNQQSR